MKKFALLSVVVLTVLLAAQVRADAPYTTWTPGPGRRLYMTQDAYTPLTEIDLPISGAEDLFVTADGALYIADAGNKRVVKLENLAIVAEYGQGVLAKPTGVFVDDRGAVYVADATHNAVFIFDKDGQLVQQFGRPTEPLFGKRREFLPRKLAVDARRNIYVVSEGLVDGLALLNPDGHFIGYFGANTASMSLKMILQRLFLTAEQLDQLIKNEAASPSNLAIDRQSMLYTVTAGTLPRRSIRKFTIAGRNIFPDTEGSSSFRDIHVSDDGLLVAVDGDGKVFEYDQHGTLLFVFNAKDTGEQRLGTLRNPTGIARYGDCIYVLDKDKNALVVYRTTAFADVVHRGVRLYMEGFYSEAKPYFEETLNYNGSFIMAYQGLADAYFKEQNYPAALQAYRYAEDRNGYSQAFWELRNVVLQRTLGPFIIGLIVLSVVQKGVAWGDRRYGWFAPWRARVRGLQRYKLVDDLVFMFRFIKKPADSFYYIKRNLRGSLAFALLVYLWVIAVRVLTLYVTAFPFSPYAYLSDIRVENEIVTVVVLLFLWNTANYLVSTISDGEGRVRDVVMGTAYSLFPYALFALPIALLSNVLTLNEIFVFSFSQDLMWAWTALMFFIMVKEVHNYSFAETVRTILLTFFTMAMIALTVYILYILFGQVFDFVLAIVQELGLRG
ncbi:MAG: YIP1 family protein [Anaerolineae bacterium]